MNLKVCCLPVFVLLSLFSYGQTKIKDTAMLLRSLDRFLSQEKTDHLDTQLLLDEMRGFRRMKPYLDNVMETGPDNYLLQLSYKGATGDTGRFKFLARQEADSFAFTPTFLVQTVLWNVRRIDNMLFIYKRDFDEVKARQLQRMISYYDKKIGAPEQQIEFYCCDNFTEVLKLVGVEYKAIYNGYDHLSLSAYSNNKTLMVNASEVDPHDLWHERLHHIISTQVINKPVDEGCAYLYGGSWGIEWKEILATFKQYAADNKDWLDLYVQEKNFVEGPKRLNVAYMINALIVQQLEKEKGFEAVKQLLCCGKREKGDENYFKALEQITSINKTNFNARVNKLLREASPL
jgi:hypothetical protein